MRLALTRAAVAAAALMLALLPSFAPAQEAIPAPEPPFTPAPVFSADGFALTVYRGASIEGLKTAAQDAGASGVWVQDSRGVFQLLPVGPAAPAFLQGEFQAAIPSIVPPLAVTLVRPAGTASPGTITLADDGKTIRLRVGDHVTLMLGDEFDWRVDPYDGNVLRQVVHVAAPPPGTQGTYVAVGVGSTDLSASGGPNCAPMQPCPLYLRLFRVHLVVSP